MSTERKRRTPHDTEVLLRRYNKQGITNWDDINECLQNETPPVHIGRSTLGEYLKECNMGTSRKTQLSDDDKRQVILQELNKPRSRNRSVRKVWKTLKVDGYHITRDFVERVMKEINPEGFTRRRPKSTVADSDPDILLPTSPPVPPSPPKKMVDVSIGPNLSGTAHHSSPPEHSVIQSQPSPAPFYISPATMEVLVQMSQRLESYNTSAELDKSCDTTKHDPEKKGNSTEGEMDHTESADNEHRGATHEHDPGGTAGFTSPNITEQHEVPSDPWIAWIKDMFPVDDGVEESVNCASHSNTMSDGVVSSNNSLVKPVLPLFPLSFPPRFWNALNNASEGEKFAQIQRWQLQNMVRDLLVQLKGWCTSGSPQVDYTPQPAQTGCLFRSGTIQISMHHRGLQENRNDVQPEIRRYVPDYDVSEDQVTKEAFFLALCLQHTLVHPKSSSKMLEASDQLWELSGRLQDIGIDTGLLVAIEFEHLTILELLEKAFRQERWILWELWMVAASCVTYTLDRSNWTSSYYTGAPIPFYRVVETAAKAARDLHSIDSTDYSLAVSLHYNWIKGAERIRGHSEPGDDLGALRESLKLFGSALESSYSSVCALEMLRTAATFCCESRDTKSIAAVVAGLNTAHSNADPNLAVLYSDIILCLPEMSDSRISKETREISFKMKTAVETLRSFQMARPSRFPSALARALHLYLELQSDLDLTDESMEAEAMDLQPTMAFGDNCATLRCCTRPTCLYLISGKWREKRQANGPRWPVIIPTGRKPLGNPRPQYLYGT